MLPLACTPDTPGVAGDASDGLVFVRMVAGTSDLARARLSDGAVRPLTHTPERAESWPYWSDGAGRVVFQVAEALVGHNADLALWDPASGREQPLVVTPRRDERWPAWAPDGSALLYAFRGGRPAAGIELLDVATGRTRLLARSGAADFFLRASFHPDGSRAVAQRRGPNGDGSHLWIVPLEGEPRALTRDDGWFDFKAWFTRDGGSVVYSRRPSGGGSHQLARVDLGGEIAVLDAASSADDHSARPSPTRDELAFVSNRAGSFDVYLADLAGRGVRPLAVTPDRDEFAPRWSPDGDRLVVTTAPVGGASLRLGDAGSLEASRLVVLDREGAVLLDTPGFMPDWMPPWR